MRSRTPLASAASSARFSHASTQSATGTHAFRGLPMLGFSTRIFRNGTLRCDAGACQGNYGGAFPFKYRRDITPAS
jgi:hypothetical protein